MKNIDQLAKRQQNAARKKSLARELMTAREIIKYLLEAGGMYLLTNYPKYARGRATACSRQI